MIETGDSHSDEGQSNTETRNFSSICEIEEEKEEESWSEVFEIDNREPMPAIKEEFDGSVFSFDFQNGEDVVYVAVGKTDSESSSMDALVWTLNHVATPSTLVFLIHIFPELRFIPTPLGKMPISQVNPEQKENHMNQERSKRREFLQKFLDVCSASKVKVDTILIESDMEAKALLDLIPILNIRKLVLGTNKSSLKKLRSRRGNGIADQVLQNAPEFCEVKIICEGKEVMMDVDNAMMTQSPSPSSRGNLVDSPSSRAPPEEVKVVVADQKNNDSFRCTCFKPKVMY
ncbi:U-box domain-containing protein 36 [Camellia sinensis]|uniref:U-box domain-containing protein 36 n=1 Tax=Camellia sinensis TaxID=4442 RepID=UPI00103644F9|nr:U-box domain-containing protein 36 [Camellia sinensis]